MNCLNCQLPLRFEHDVLTTLGLRSAAQHYFCDQCMETFQALNDETTCRGCGRQQESSDICYDCQRWVMGGKELLNNQACFSYNQAMKDYMQCYKFQGDYRLRNIFQKEFQNLIQARKVKIIVPIPVSEQTRLTRGFNQVTALLKKGSYQDILTVGIGDKGQQSLRGRADRMIGQQPFALQTKIDLTEKEILLVDDIYTTGATLYHASDVLYLAGAKRVMSATLAR